MTDRERRESSFIRAATGRWDGTLDKTLRAALIPYGYTVTIWATGAYIIRGQQVPGITALDGLLFLSGAMLAFALLATYAQRHMDLSAEPSEPTPIHPDSSHPILLAGLHIVAAGIAFGGGVLVKAIVGGAATWFLAPFVVTLLYLTLSTLELTMAIEWHRRRTAATGSDGRRLYTRRFQPRRGSEMAYSAPTEYGVEEQPGPRDGRGHSS